jgi:hypothetical protein
MPEDFANFGGAQPKKRRSGWIFDATAMFPADFAVGEMRADPGF